MVDAHHAGVAAGIENPGGDAAGTLQHRQQIVRRCFLPILLARLQRSDACRRVRHRRPDHAIVVNDLGTGGPVRLAVLARLIAIEAGIDVARACTRSSATKRNGPLPTTSVSGLNGSWFASRSGIMKGAAIAALPSAAGNSGKGLFSRKRMVRSSGADNRRSPPSAQCRTRRAPPIGECSLCNRAPARARRHATAGRRAS